MDVRGSWKPFEASGLYEADPLAFAWRARLKMLPGVWILAEDGHRQGVGWGGARLWGVLSMGRRTDPEVLKTQLVRNLAELAWLPALALADPALKWSDAGANAFEVACTSGGQEGNVRFELSQQGDIVVAHSPARPFDEAGGYAEAPWRYDFSHHRQLGGVRLPVEGVATYEKPDGPWQYMKVTVIAAQIVP
jgi:hypothetical protein